MAGTSINAIVGDNGLLRQTQDAKLTAEEVSRREALEFLLLDYNTSKFLDEANGLGKYLEGLVTTGELEGFAATTDGDYAIITYKGKTYEVERQSENSEYYKVLDEVSEDLGDINGNYILTTKTVNQVISENGTFQFEDGKSYIIIEDEMNADNFDFNIPAGSEVTLKIMHNMIIDNSKNPGRAAINLDVEKTEETDGTCTYKNGAILNLYIYDKVLVNSSYGEDGETGESSEGAKGQSGGKAGIRVPKTATLNLYGRGTLIAYGGSAGNGGSDTGDGNTGGAGGSGAGAGIGGNGGVGGNANINKNTGIDMTIDGYTFKYAGGYDGGAGEDCGNININDDLIVYAYGGKGGNGGEITSVNSMNQPNSGGGGGGYPAAGIGGGGAGGGGRRSC